MDLLTQVLIHDRSRPLRPPHRRSAPVREVHTRSLRRALQESLKTGDMVSLTPSEARTVLRLLDESSRDPFTYRAGAFDTEDLKAVGVQMPTANTVSANTAISAPEATAEDDDPPPPEIADELRTLSGEEDEASTERQPKEPDFDAVALALVQGSAGPPPASDADDGLKGSTTSKRDAVAHKLVGEQTESVNSDLSGMLAGLRNARQQVAEEKKRRLEEQQQRLSRVK